MGASPQFSRFCFNLRSHCDASRHAFYPGSYIGESPTTGAPCLDEAAHSPNSLTVVTSWRTRQALAIKQFGYFLWPIQLIGEMESQESTSSGTPSSRVVVLCQGFGVLESPHEMNWKGLGNHQRIMGLISWFTGMEQDTALSVNRCSNI